MRTDTWEKISRDHIIDSKYVRFQTSETEVKSRELSVNSRSDARKGKTLVLKMPFEEFE